MKNPPPGLPPGSIFAAVVAPGVFDKLLASWAPEFQARRMARGIVAIYKGTMPTTCRVFFTGPRNTIYEILDNAGSVKRWVA